MIPRNTSLWNKINEKVMFEECSVERFPIHPVWMVLFFNLFKCIACSLTFLSFRRIVYHTFKSFMPDRMSNIMRMHIYPFLERVMCYMTLTRRLSDIPATTFLAILQHGMACKPCKCRSRPPVWSVGHRSLRSGFGAVVGHAISYRCFAGLQFSFCVTSRDMVIDVRCRRGRRRLSLRSTSTDMERDVQGYVFPDSRVADLRRKLFLLFFFSE